VEVACDILPDPAAVLEDFNARCSVPAAACVLWAPDNLNDTEILCTPCLQRKQSSSLSGNQGGIHLTLQAHETGQ
jgi:hypothetical protein